MKKATLISTLLAAVLLFTLAACGAPAPVQSQPKYVDYTA